MRRAFMCGVTAMSVIVGFVRPVAMLDSRASGLGQSAALAAALPQCVPGGSLDVTVAASPLTLRNCQISGKVGSGNGGGVYVDGGATLNLIGVVVTGNSAGGSGGGIFNNGTLNLTNATITNNRATNGAGGGVFNNGTLTIAGSTFQGNTSGYGGGIYNNQGAVLSISGSTFGGASSGQGNTVSVSGGGVYSANGTASISSTTFTGNSATYSGGALEAYGGQISLHATTFTGNHAGVDAGAIQMGLGTLCNCGSGDPTVKITGNTAGTTGGGIENHFGQVTLDTASISGNSAGATGGGIQNKGGAYVFTNSVFSGNQPQNCAQTGGTISDGGNNTDSDGSCGFVGPPTASGALIAQDTFVGRSVSGGWGTASSGVSWTLQSGSNGVLSVAGNKGIIRGTQSSAYQMLTLGSSPVNNEEVVARYSTGSFGDDVGRLLLRFSNTQNYYAAGLGSPGGATTLQITRTSGGATSQLCSVPFSVTNGTAYWERVRIQTSSGTAVLSARAWPSGTSEPTSWQISCTDSTPLGAGLTGVDGWDGGVNWSVDTFSAGNLDAGSHLHAASVIRRPSHILTAVPACTLLTPVDVASVFGSGIRPGLHRSIGTFDSCNYSTQGGILTFLAATTSSLSTSKDQGGRDAARMYARIISTVPGKPHLLTGLGDKALWAPGIHQLWVLKGNLLFSLSYFASGEATLTRLEQVARKVLAHSSV